MLLSVVLWPLWLVTIGVQLIAMSVNREKKQENFMMKKQSVSPWHLMLRIETLS